MNSVDEQLQNIVTEWSELLQIKGTIRVILSDNTSGGCDAALDPPEIRIPLDYDELLVAHELSHLALAQRIDLCFGQFVFNKQLKVKNRDDSHFMRQVAAAGRFKDLFVDDLLVSVKPNMVRSCIDDDIKTLEDVSETPDLWQRELGDIKTVELLGAIAIASVGPERQGVGELAIGARLTAKIVNQVQKARGVREADKITRLCDLCKRLPTLPEERFEAVSLFEKTTQETAEILGLPRPILLYDKEEDKHNWSR